MLAVLGWVVGIPLGYLIERAFVWLVRELLEVEVVVVYPLSHVAVALALVVIRLPLRRAVRFRPGDALRYA